MDAIETQVQRTSPILRITTDITEFKSRGNKEERLSETSQSRQSEANLRHASNLLQKKKQLRPLFGSPNPYRTNSFYTNSPYSIHSNSKLNVGPFTQRVMSAKLLRVKKLQNELKETQIQLHEAISENRILKTLQKRQDNALKKYEGDNAQLPQLIKSHNDDLRVITTQFKQLKAAYRELDQRLRQKDAELVNLKDQHKHLIELSRDKHLGQREKLMRQVEDLQDIVKEQNEKIQLLTRRVELEGKNYKHQLGAEMARHKDTQVELTMAHETIETLKNLIEAKDKYINNTVPYRNFKMPSGNVQIFSNSSSTARIKPITKTSSTLVIPQQLDSIETLDTTRVDDINQEKDNASGLLSGGSSRNQKSVLQDLNTELTATLPFRKRLTRKSRLKSNINSTSLLDTNNSSIESEEQDYQSDRRDGNGNDTETPQYTSSFPSINNSDDSKYNTMSESDAMTKINSGVKGRRRISIDSVQSNVSDGCNRTNDEHCDEFQDGNIKLTEKDNSDIKPIKKSLSNSRRVEQRSRRNSASVCGSDDRPLENINNALEKAKRKDGLRRKQLLDNEIEALEDTLRKNSSIDGSVKSVIDDDSLEKFFDQKTQLMKNELKEFEERLLKANDLKTHSNSTGRSFDDEADDVVKKITAGFSFMPHSVKDEEESNDDENELDPFGNAALNDMPLNWDSMRDKFEKERLETDALLDEYYKKMMYNNKVETETPDVMDSKDIELDNTEKLRLLKALKEIDLEKTSETSGSGDGRKGRRNSVNHAAYDFTSIDDTNRSKPFENYEFPLLNSGNIDDDDGEFTQEYDSSFVKSKSDLMEELFGKPKNISIVDTRNDLNST